MHMRLLFLTSLRHIPPYSLQGSIETEQTFYVIELAATLEGNYSSGRCSQRRSEDPVQAEQSRLEDLKAECGRL
ncbi:hypothetical protein EAI_11781 [Harpegnathos saltator]|uniref:Uncharacterized protein n=1 Tax=Harpegnathos saltator TaxID=610380 RepID=E2B5P5_HARSA|nr:hypothetical protein EAI_11781 [Harpegnathos saltator]